MRLMRLRLWLRLWLSDEMPVGSEGAPAGGKGFETRRTQREH